LLAPAPKPLNCKSLAGNSMWSFLSFWLSTKVDGYQDGMPNLPASTTTSIGRLVHLFILLKGFDWHCPTC
jgi:hypothetical protein